MIFPKKSKKISLALLPAIILLTSCAQYQANYQPPSNAAGMQCVNTCLMNQQACNNNCHNQRMISNIASNVTDALRYGKNKNPHYNYSSSNTYSYSSDDCGCQAAYNECYRSCGGKIDFVCVANCK